MVGIVNNVDKRIQIPITDGTAGQEQVAFFIGSGAPSGGTTSAATGFGFAAKGSLYSDYTNAYLYIMTGTGPNSLSWTKVGAQS